MNIRPIQGPTARRKVWRFFLCMFYGALIGAFLAIIAVIRSPHSHADPNQDMFKYDLNWVNAGGGQAVCQILDDNGLTTYTVTKVIVAVMKVSGVDGLNAAQIINYSVYIYCPKYWSTLQEIGNEARQGGMPANPVPNITTGTTI